MDELIQRQAVLAEIFKKPAWHNSDGSYYHADDIRDAVNSVKSQERTGHWIIMGGRYIKCSKCRHITKTESPDIYNFCMVCGTKMSEEPEYEAEVIAKGKPLPKNNGRLIILSEEAVKSEYTSLGFSCQSWISDVGLSNATVAIIEAEKEE